MKADQFERFSVAESDQIPRKNAPWFETKTSRRTSKHDPIAAVIASNLRRARIKANLSQVDAADAIGVSRVVISTWEVGRNQIGVVYLIKAMRVYGVTFTQMLTGEGLPELVDRAFEMPNIEHPGIRQAKPKEIPRAPEHSDACDTFDPSLMCPGCLAILRKVTA